MTTTVPANLDLTTAPKRLQDFVAAAERAGFTAKVTRWGKPGAVNWDVWVEHQDGRNAGLYWQTENVAPNNSRLGFPTSYTPGLRFSYANAHAWGEHYAPTSVAKVAKYLHLDLP